MYVPKRREKAMNCLRKERESTFGLAVEKCNSARDAYRPDVVVVARGRLGYNKSPVIVCEGNAGFCARLVFGMEQD